MYFLLFYSIVIVKNEIKNRTDQISRSILRFLKEIDCKALNDILERIESRIDSCLSRVDGFKGLRKAIECIKSPICLSDLLNPIRDSMLINPKGKEGMLFDKCHYTGNITAIPTAYLISLYNEYWNLYIIINNNRFIVLNLQ